MMTALAVRSLLLLSSTCYLACASVLLAGDEVRNMEQNTRAQGRGLGIVGGQRAHIRDMPYYASFDYKTSLYDTAIGAVIVHERFVLTSGRIVRYYIRDVSKYRVVVGRDDFLGPRNNYDIEKAFIHPNMSNHKWANDKWANNIAVIKLTRKIMFGELVKPIKMADSSLVLKPGDQLMVMGYGQTDTGRLPRFLQSVNVPYYDYEKCAKLMKPVGITLTKTVICAGGENGKGPCMDDFGDPLVYNNTLVGLVSGFLLPCKTTANNDYPAMFTNIASVRPFIDGIINSEL